MEGTGTWYLFDVVEQEMHYLVSQKVCTRTGQEHEHHVLIA